MFMEQHFTQLTLVNEKHTHTKIKWIWSIEIKKPANEMGIQYRFLHACDSSRQMQ